MRAALRRQSAAVRLHRSVSSASLLPVLHLCSVPIPMALIEEATFQCAGAAAQLLSSAQAAETAQQVRPSPAPPPSLLWLMRLCAMRGGDCVASPRSPPSAAPSAGHLSRADAAAGVACGKRASQRRSSCRRVAPLRRQRSYSCTSGARSAAGTCGGGCGERPGRRGNAVNSCASSSGFPLPGLCVLRSAYHTRALSPFELLSETSQSEKCVYHNHRVVMAAAAALKRAVSGRTFSGIQPTGIPHLGNYYGAITNWVASQDAAAADAGSSETIYSIVDLHAMSMPYDAKTLRQKSIETAAALMACGISPDRSILFCQSAVREHTELAWT